jgi:hypothetical protein
VARPRAGDPLDLFGQDDAPLAGLTAKVVTEHKGWEAEREGYEAGKSGEPSDNCKHNPGTEFHQRWMVGWHGGYVYRQEAEARGEQINKPRKGSDNPEDNDGGSPTDGVGRGYCQALAPIVGRGAVNVRDRPTPRHFEERGRRQGASARSAGAAVAYQTLTRF